MHDPKGQIQSRTHVMDPTRVDALQRKGCGPLQQDRHTLPLDSACERTKNGVVAEAEAQWD